MTTTRIALPGDIFLLLVPTAQELHHLHQRQLALQARFGGQLAKHIHVTCQRFTPDQEVLETLCYDSLKRELQTIQPFTIYSDQLVQFFAPYWQHHVLRWRVQETEAYASFRNTIETTLEKIGCPTHFERQRHATCTAINLVKPVDLDQECDEQVFPTALFEAKVLAVSKLKDENQFEIIDTITMADETSPPGD